MKNSFKTTFYGIAAMTFACLAFYACTPATTADDTATAYSNSKIYHVSENDSVNIGIVVNFLTSLVNGDGSVAKSSVTADFMSYGPASRDSSTIEQLVTDWMTTATERTNQELGIQAQSGLTVTEGPLAGDWVHIWGTYSATHNESGKALRSPWHSAFKIEDGKISWARRYFDRLEPSMDLGAVVPAN